MTPTEFPEKYWDIIVILYKSIFTISVEFLINHVHMFSIPILRTVMKTVMKHLCSRVQMQLHISVYSVFKLQEAKGKIL